MSSAPNAPVIRIPHEPSPLGAFLSYLIPGLGQIYQQRYSKGALFMVSLLGMFMLGQAMGNWQNVYLPRQREAVQQKGGKATPTSWLDLFPRWQYGGQFWIGVAAWPALYHFYTAPARQAQHVNDEEVPFWKRYQSEPDENREVNPFLVISDKTPDLGWVYTVIAGMLNLLVIYDAYAGPLFGLTVRPAARTSATMEAAQKGGVA
jgi:hypothetical protein